MAVPAAGSHLSRVAGRVCARRRRCQPWVPARSATDESGCARCSGRIGPVGSTGDVYFLTRKGTMPAEKSEVSHVTFDGVGGNTWEQILGLECELHADVAARQTDVHSTRSWWIGCGRPSSFFVCLDTSIPISRQATPASPSKKPPLRSARCATRSEEADRRRLRVDRDVRV